MPRASRYFLPGDIWHITHRPYEEICSKRSSRSIVALVQAVEDEKTEISTYFGARDRRRNLHWLFEARKRFGLCVLDYIVTSNHIHLLVKDTGTNVIARSMQ